MLNFKKFYNFLNLLPVLKEEAEEEMEAEPKAEAQPKTVIERTEVERKFQEELDAVKAELFAAQTAQDGMVKKLAKNNEIIEAMFRVMETLAGKPSAEPTKPTRDLRDKARKAESDKALEQALAFASSRKKK